MSEPVSGNGGLHGLGLSRRVRELGARATAMVLAGGKGERLQPLTQHRLKAAVPFGTHSSLEGGTVRNSVVGPDVWIRQGALVENSIIFGKTVIEERVKVRQAIIDHGNIITTGGRVGYDKEHDASRYRITDGGIVVIPHAPWEENTERRMPWTEDALFAGMRMLA